MVDLGSDADDLGFAKWFDGLSKPGLWAFFKFSEFDFFLLFCDDVVDGCPDKYVAGFFI